jgi:hypothetical protein
MRALVIDEKAKTEIARVISYAQKHMVTVADLIKNLDGAILPVGDNPEYVCHFFDGFRVVYSIEDQPHCGLCHHLSVSVNTEGRAPSPDAVEAIMRAFGISGTINDCLNVWLENDTAVNLLQKVESGETNGGSI